MSDEKISLTAALRHLAEQERRTPSEHATPGELTAYHEGTLAPAIEARVQEHLAHCKLCSDLLLDLAGFADLAPPPGVPELTDAQMAEDWQALRSRMGAEKERDKEPATVVPFRREPAAEPGKSRGAPPWFAIAASLLAVAGFSFGFYEKAELQKSRQEQAGAEFVNDTIYLSTGSSRGPEETKVMSSQEGGYLDLDVEKSYDRYEADFISGKTVVLSLKSGGQPLIHIHGGTLKPGTFQIRLFGVLNGNRELAGEFPLQVNAP